MIKALSGKKIIGLCIVFILGLSFISFISQKKIKSLFFTNLSVLSILKGDSSTSYQQSLLAKEYGFINSGQYYHQYMLDHESSDLKNAFFLNPTNVNYIFLYADETILKGDWLTSNQHFNKVPFARYLARRGTELANDSDPINAKKGLYYLGYARKILSEPQISNSLGSVLCFKYKSFQKGEPLLWEALKTNPKNTSYYESLSQLFANKDRKELYRSFNVLIRRNNPSNINTLINIGNSFVKENKIDEGIQYFLAAKIKDKKKPQIHYLLARVYEKLEKYDLVEREYTEAIEFNPMEYEPRFEWGVYLFQKKNFTKAITQFTVAMTLKPEYVWNYYYRGLSYQGNNNFKKALEDFTYCLKLETNNQMFKNKLIEINEQLKKMS